MKTILSLAILAFVSLSFTTVQATAPAPGPSPDIVAEAPFVWDFDCDKIDCPIKREVEFTQSFWAHDCKSIPAARIEEAVKDIVDRFCSRFKECCRENGCTTDGYCRLVDFKYDCRTEHLLVIKVKIAIKCE